MASTPHPPPKHPDPPAHKHDTQPPVTRAPNAPAPASGEHRDPQEMKLELAARDVQNARDAQGGLHEYVPGEGERNPAEYLSVADEQRARSAEMEREGGPQKWMRAHETSPTDEEGEAKRKGVVPGVGTEPVAARR